MQSKIKKHFNMQRSQCGQCAQSKKQRIARQDRRYHKAGFAKNNNKYNHINPDTKALDDYRQILDRGE